MHPLRSWYSRFFAWIYDPVMKLPEKRYVRRLRQELLAGIEGNILDVGAGTGANFEWFPAGARVMAVDPATDMLKRANENRKKSRADIQLINTGIEDPQLERQVPPAGFDAVVFTLVLCTVADPDQTLDKVIGWLRPGGRMYVFEHIVSSNPAGRRLQQLVNPCWNVLAEGCHLTRPTDQILRSKGLKLLWERYDQKGLLFYAGVWEA